MPAAFQFNIIFKWLDQLQTLHSQHIFIILSTISFSELSLAVILFEIFCLFHNFIKNFFVPFRRISIFIEKHR